LLFLTLDVDVDEDLLFLTLDADVDGDFLFLFWTTALSTASFGGYTISTGCLGTTMLVSVLAKAAFFCLFFGRPLQATLNKS
jgi:hypothetical protein